MSGSDIIYMAGLIYGAVGLAVAGAFILFALEAVAPPARGAIAFRPVLVPGLVLLWPLVLWRWRQSLARQA